VNQIIESVEGPGPLAWLPESARRVLLVSPDDGDWGGAAAVEVAEMVARHRPRTLLVNTVTGSSGSDHTLHLDDRPGLAEVVAGRCRVKEVAITPPGRSFIAVPAGQTKPGVSKLCRLPAFRHLVDAAGRGGTLLLHVARADLAHLFAESDVCGGLEFDGLVLLGDEAVPQSMPAEVRFLARVERDAAVRPPPPEPTPAPGLGSSFTRPKDMPAIVAGGGARRRPRGRLERLVEDVRKHGVARGAGGVALVWIVAVIAVWLVWQGLSGWPAFEDDFDSPVDSPVSEHLPPGSESEEEARAGQGSSVAEEESDASLRPVEDSSVDESVTPPEPRMPEGVVLPYSVLVASHVNYEDAAAERDRLTESGSMAFVAPTPIGGRLYYRVFAGALEDRFQASDRMRRLVEQGSKERERDWDMRPVRLAFALRDFSSEEEADAERVRLHELGVPAYVLPVGDTTGAIYRLYSGAFESEEAAGPADTLLSVAGQVATLVTRRGEPR
jgi:cell division septation protein DedD